MKTRVRLAMLFATLLVFVPQVILANNQDRQRGIFLRDLDYLYYMGKEVYSYWDLKKEQYGVDWDSIYQTARGKMEQATNVYEYMAILKKMTASVKDGHVNAWINDPKNSLYDIYMPLDFKEIDKHIYVSNVDKAQFLGKPYVDVGDELIAIDGVPVEEKIDEYSRYRSGSTPRMVRQSVIAFILNTYVSTSQAPESNPLLTVKKYGEGSIKKVEVPWIVYDSWRDIKIISEEWQASNLVYAKVLPSNIGYLRIATMWPRNDKISDDDFLNYIADQFQTLLNTKAMIIDVRNNGGGDNNVGRMIESYLIDKPTVVTKISARMSPAMLIQRPELVEFGFDPSSNGYYSKWRDIVVDPVDDALRYRGKVLILTNSKCFSACDTFVDEMASNGLAMTMGEDTGGGTGWPLLFDLPSGLAVAGFSTIRGYSNFGRYLEGVGTLVDIKASQSLESLVKGTDSVLQKAHTLLKYDVATKTPSASILEKSEDIVESNGFPLEKTTVLPGFVREKMFIEESSHEYNPSRH